MMKNKKSSIVKIKDLFKAWNIEGITFNFGFGEVAFAPTTLDQKAAWELYVELVTRISTQELESNSGVEKVALDSVYKLFDITREILKDNGRKCEAFSRIAIILLNQILRPFTSKWHKLSVEGAFDNPTTCLEFRTELAEKQKQIRCFTLMLAKIASVQDLSNTSNFEDSSILKELGI